MPRAQPVPLRPAAEAAPAQRPRRTRPRLVAIRVLWCRSPPVPPQTPPAPHRRLRPSLQSHKASPSPWRSHPSRGPLNHQPGDRPVSHGLNSDNTLHPDALRAQLTGVAADIAGLTRSLLEQLELRIVVVLPRASLRQRPSGLRRAHRGPASRTTCNEGPLALLLTPGCGLVSPLQE